MLALLRDVLTDEPCGVHRTFLDDDGRKLGRKMLGRAKQAAVKLDPNDSVTFGLVIGEGIETCLTARLAGLRPVWCLGSAGGIEYLPVLAGIEAVTILAENDANGANKRAVDVCAKRWRDAGRGVFIVEPLIGNDFSDAWAEAQR